jgi:P-type Cu+ transporter
MHSQIRQEGPGNCPICGMALEPLEMAPQAGPNPELKDMTRRFWVGLALTVPVVILEMGAHVPGLSLHEFVPSRLLTWIQFLLATPAVLWAGWPFFQRGWASVVSRNLNMFTLIALGTGTAWLYSVVATLAPGIFPTGFRGMDGVVAVYFEAAAVITVLVLLGQVLELRAREHHPRLAEPGAQDGLGVSMNPGRTKKSPWPKPRSGTICAFDPVTLCRWTAGS